MGAGSGRKAPGNPLRKGTRWRGTGRRAFPKDATMSRDRGGGRREEGERGGKVTPQRMDVLVETLWPIGGTEDFRVEKWCDSGLIS